jgi:hypothetical protein
VDYRAGLDVVEEKNSCSYHELNPSYSSCPTQFHPGCYLEAFSKGDMAVGA